MKNVTSFLLKLVPQGWRPAQHQIVDATRSSILGAVNTLTAHQRSGVSLFRRLTRRRRMRSWESQVLESRLLLTTDFHLVDDLNTLVASSDPDSFTVVGATVYFTASTAINGREIWKSDGTIAGTVLIKDINPGIFNSSPRNLTNVSGTLFFTADNGSTGEELWKSDGTAAGTSLVKDLSPGESGTFLFTNQYVSMDGTFYFLSSSGGGTQDLWRSDGTSDGTFILKTFHNGSSYWPQQMLVIDQQFYFTANDNVHGTELWKSDGTIAGTVLVRDIKPGSSGSHLLLNLTNVNGLLFFSAAATDGSVSTVLWKSDGTESGTVVVKQIPISSAGRGINFPANVNGTLYFRTDDNVHGEELWKSDGTEAGTVLVRDILPGAGHGFPTYLNNINGTLFFTANDGTSGQELWTSDGTEAGTKLVTDISAGATSGDPRLLTNVNGTLFFRATSASTGFELWKSDGTPSGTSLVKDIWSGVLSGNPRGLTNLNGTLLFQAHNSEAGTEFWKSDGTLAGTQIVKDIHAGSDSADPRELTNLNGDLLFRMSNGSASRLVKTGGTAASTEVLLATIRSSGTRVTSDGNSLGSFTHFDGGLLFNRGASSSSVEIWSTDGTGSGTSLLKDMSPGTYFIPPDHFTVVGDTIYFSAYRYRYPDIVELQELWKSDGTESGTVLVKDISNGASSSPNWLTNVNGKLYFTADDRTHGIELWSSDGTSAGTVMVQDLQSGLASSSPENLINFNDTLYFTANNGANGIELWKSDGTSSGTTLVKDINPGSGGSSPSNLTIFNGMLYFTANDGSHGYELWKSDGTAAGTMLVKDINVGTASADPGELTNVAGTLFFTATNGASGMELWKTNGTSASTTLVKDIRPGAQGSFGRYLTNINGTLWFSADDGVHGQELWWSNGTSSGTSLYHDFTGDAAGSFPSQPVQVGDLVYTAATVPNTGRELYVAEYPFPPTDIVLSANVVAEKLPAGTIIGTLSATDQNSVDSFSFSLVAGSGDADNNAFTISGNNLKSAVVFDYETRSDFSIRVLVTDHFGYTFEKQLVIDVSDVNEEPTLTLQSAVSQFNENISTTPAVRVADIHISDDAIGTNVVSLTGADASRFKIIGGQLFLKSGVALNFEQQSSLTVTVQVDDLDLPGGPESSVTLVVSINDVNEAPTVTLKNTVSSFSENITTTTARRVADIVITDDALGTNTLSLSGPDAAKFEIQNSRLWLKAGTYLNFEAQSTLTVNVLVDDTGVGTSPDSTISYVLTVTDVNEPPSVSLTSVRNSLPENANAAGVVRVANIQIQDDALGDNLITLTGPEADRFIVVGSELRVRASAILDFEEQNTFQVTVNINDTAIPGTPDASVDYRLTLTNVNEKPNVVLSSAVTTIEENTSTLGGIRVANISVIDDALGTNTLSLGGADAARFQIRNNELVLRQGTVLNFESKRTYRVIVFADDSSIAGTPDAATPFTLTLTDLNERPSRVVFSNVVTSIPENTIVSTRLRVADITIVDDALGTNVPGLSGYDAAKFELRGQQLYLKAGTRLNFELQSFLYVTLTVDDTTLPGAVDYLEDFALEVSDVNEAPNLRLTNVVGSIQDNFSTVSAIRVADISIIDDALGRNSLTLSGPDASRFTIANSKLWLKPGNYLNGVKKPRFDVTIAVNDKSLGTTIGTWNSRSLQLNVVATTPQVRSPITPTQSLRPTISWSRVTPAVQYEVAIFRSNSTATAVLSSTVSTTTFRPATSMDIGRYIVKVRSIDAAGRLSRWSAAYAFVINTPVTLKTVLVNQPAPRPTIRWAALPGAARYQLQIDNLTTFQAFFVWKTNLTSTSWTAATNFPPNRYGVRVRAIAADGTVSRWSAYSEFSISAAGSGSGSANGFSANVSSSAGPRRTEFVSEFAIDEFTIDELALDRLMESFHRSPLLDE